MVDFLEFQTIIQFRVPLNADGTPGDPQIMKRFTTAIKGAQHKVHRPVVRNLVTSVGEEVYI